MSLATSSHIGAPSSSMVLSHRLAQKLPPSVPGNCASTVSSTSVSAAASRTITSWPSRSAKRSACMLDASRSRAVALR